MKRHGISILAALALVSVAARSSAQDYNDYTAYTSSTFWTNFGSGVWDINSGPRTPGSGYPNISPSITVDTDGSGKITGSGSLTITYNASGVPFSYFVVDLTGKISSTTLKPTAKAVINVKGYGYTDNGMGAADRANITLKFSGEPGPNPSNPAQTRIVGTIEGNLSGPSPLGAKSARLSGLVGYVSSSSSNTASLNIDLLTTPKRLVVVDRDFNGSGLPNAKQTEYRLSLSGIHFQKGIKFSLSGNMGPYTNSYGPTNITFLAPTTATMKGTALGQVIAGEAGFIDAELIP